MMLPGFLEDCEIPPEISLQSNGVSLYNIAKKICDKFKIKIKIEEGAKSDANKVLKSSSAGEAQNCKSYLTSLAVQKNIVLSHDEFGNLVFTKAVKTTPILKFDLTKESYPGTDFDFEFNGQGMHSHIYVRGQADDEGGNAKEAFLRNKYVPTVFRPTVKTQSSGDDNDSAKAVNLSLIFNLNSDAVPLPSSLIFVFGWFLLKFFLFSLSTYPLPNLSDIVLYFCPFLYLKHFGKANIVRVHKKFQS